MDKRLIPVLITATAALATAQAAPAQARPAHGTTLLAATSAGTHALDPRTGRVLRQFADGSDAVVSSQRRRIAFSRDVDPCFPDPAPDGGCSGAADLLTARLDGTDERVIVHNAEPSGSMTRPDWSPDGRQVAFHWGIRGERGLAVVNADGSNLRHLVNSAGAGTFSPDGTRIAYPLDGDIHVVDVATGATRAITTEGLADADPPDWAPDGRHIVYGGDHAFFTVPAAGGASVGSTWDAPLSQVSTPVFSPDGRRVAFVATDRSTPDGTWLTRVYVANRDGSGLTAVARGYYGLTDWIGF